ncbi:hypothetical protein BGZ83_005761 [Gryganskiella cystojenkinii]|nr:hypothetical protein BGZ83_005761 [Gryganskiella cystojenkinii]
MAVSFKSRVFVSVTVALTIVCQLISTVSATPYRGDSSDLLGVGGYGGAYGQGGYGDAADCETDVPVQPTWIHPVTNFIPETNVQPQVNVLPTDFNDFSCDSLYGCGNDSPLLEGGFGSTGDFGYGGGIGDYGYGGFGNGGYGGYGGPGY